MKRKAIPAVKRPPVKKRTVSKQTAARAHMPASSLKRIILPEKDGSIHVTDIPYSWRGNDLKDLRVLMVIDQFNIGGTGMHVLSCTRQLLRKGVHVAIAGKNGLMGDAFAALGCPIYELDFVTDGCLRNDAEEKAIVTQLKQIMTSEGINVVHAHQIPAGYFAAAAAEQLTLPLVLTLHQQYSAEQVDLLNKSRAAICVSKPILKHLPVHGLPSKLIPNGIDTVQFDYRPLIEAQQRKALGIPDTAPVVMYAGRLSREKAGICRDTIEACKQLKLGRYPELHLLIAGDGHQSAKIRELADEANEQAGQPFIHMLGNSLNMSPYYTISNCVVGTGRIALEAMACRRPVIAVGSRGFFGEVVPSNYVSAWETWFGDHLATEPWTAAKIKESVLRVLSLPPGEIADRGWAGRNLVKEQFNIVRLTEKMLDVYQEVLQDRSAVYEVTV
ncbi:glycosyltransferase [Paenibacillus thermotolerans]|uniref:glycosyltransferase n=1 Tax=Paenibacillus thermotolerans TaxID=3027807 RepID=UPI002367D805|nr:MULTISPECIES: glycosyltransferase [unclassified Paenibacillus]